MAAKHFYESELLPSLIGELKESGVKFQREVSNAEEFLDRHIGYFEAATGANEDSLFDILQNGSEDFKKYIIGIGYRGRYDMSGIMLRVIDFALMRHFPEKHEDYLSRYVDAKYLPKIAHTDRKQYNDAFGLATEEFRPQPKPKAAPVPKAGPARTVPLHETGLKYSEYDEDYYAIQLEGGKEGNTFVNPIVEPMEKKDGVNVHIPFPPIYGDHKDFRYSDVLRASYLGLFVSERVRMQLVDAIPAVKERAGGKGPGFGEKVYIRNGDDYLPYYILFIPEYRFIDKTRLKLIEGSKGIVCYPEGTDGLEDIVYHSFRPGVMAKTPEAERSVFEVDFHGVGWKFCLRHIQEKFEAAGATGMRFVRSMDMNWQEYKRT